MKIYQFSHFILSSNALNSAAVDLAFTIKGVCGSKHHFQK